MLDGRVKTIHPRIAAGVLAIRSNPAHMRALEQHSIGRIDMVVVNLYAFEKIAARKDAAVHELIENIDNRRPHNDSGGRQELSGCGGSRIAGGLRRHSGRAGDKRRGFDRHLLAPGQESLFTHRGLRSRHRRETFHHRVPGRPVPRGRIEPSADSGHTRPARSISLRYGENPHQSAALYANSTGGIAGAQQLHGKELSYNNLVDLDAAWQLIQEFDNPASAIIKHTNPCGCAEQDTLAGSYRKAFEADPVSAFGGVLAFNRTVDEETAGEISKTFIEAIAAPGYSPEALAILQAKKNLRLLQVGGAGEELVVKSISGGYLAQTQDTHRLDRQALQVKTARQPTDAEWQALEFAWKVVKHVKSNAIVYANAGQSVSAGAGQMSRVDSVKVGAMKAVLPLQGTVLASDAFFPFPDGVEQAAQHGITAVIQPGGSVRDDEVIAAANRLGLAMVFTGIRHFRH
jgi:AICAR transformylase/IMP cyclohydrolase PurH (only IMP cyclohydrolase domain in Aful)